MMQEHCSQCLLPQNNCVCSRLPAIKIPFEIVIVRHFQAAQKASNTAFVASLCIPDLRLIDVAFPRDLHELEAQAGDILLFPPHTPAPPPSSEELPKRLIVLDGSWRQARKIYRQNPCFQKIPHLALAPRETPPPRILTPSTPDGMCTMEAISRCFEYFGLQEEGELLHNALCDFVEERRKVTGIRIPIPPGMSFSDVRKLGF